MVVSIGRNPKCDIVVDNKKVSSHHCAIRFIQDTSTLSWSVQIEPGTNNSTFVGPTRVTEPQPYPLSPDHPVKLSLVFPEIEKAVETFVVSLVAPVRREPTDDLSPEEKRLKRELRDVERQTEQWEKSYNEESLKLMDAENALVREIVALEKSVGEKSAEVKLLKDTISRVECDMRLRENEFTANSTLIKDAHAKYYTLLTERLDAANEKLANIQ